jgi:hypothetical protein
MTWKPQPYKGNICRCTLTLSSRVVRFRRIRVKAGVRTAAGADSPQARASIARAPPGDIEGKPTSRGEGKPGYNPFTTTLTDHMRAVRDSSRTLAAAPGRDLRTSLWSSHTWTLSLT